MRQFIDELEGEIGLLTLTEHEPRTIEVLEKLMQGPNRMGAIVVAGHLSAPTHGFLGCCYVA